MHIKMSVLEEDLIVNSFTIPITIVLKARSGPHS